ncbi:AAA family ATPase [Gracilibacillus salitolerans]|uniref:AAA family ATPase n=1 Tax=Gracilibacillus salitolerans TaxID=2663022 RepID=A0A5Q2TDD4_9BACI|nr:AAA family ATPase [Gracilibacillus salitolerans]QGH32606.1 AAA family ATPase [Gracilibacillus salitolerans]
MIKKIYVEKLFGYLDYPIDFSEQKNNIVLLHGPNGSGKTTIFEMIKGISDLDFRIFISTPFKRFVIETDKTSIHIRRNEDCLIINDDFEINSDDINETNILYDLDNKPFYEVVEILELNYGVKRVGLREFEYQGEKYKRNDLISHIKNQVIIKNVPEWLTLFSKELNILFIKAERLFDNQSRKVVQQKNNLKEIIRNYENKYAILSKELDAKFPKKIITKSLEKNNEINSVDIAKRLQNLSLKRHQLSRKGILTDNDTNDLIPADDIKSDDIYDNDYLKQFLYYYILDNEEKLDVFNTLLSKLETFEKIINGYFVNKKIIISKKTGFSFILSKGNLKGQPIPLKKLSSGEQHFLVLFFELIFNTEENRVILIDEPEISLHVSWQIKLVDILKDIIDLSDDFFILATHSPSILRNHRDKVISVGYDND